MTDILAELSRYLPDAGEALTRWAGTFARIGSAAFFLPLLGERVVPLRIRLVCAIALSLAVAPIVASELPARIGAGFLLLETAVGLAFGFGLRALVIAMQVAGTIAAQSISLAQFLGAPSAEPAPAVGHLLVIGALALVAVQDFPLLIVEAAVESYALVPPGLALQPGAVADGVLLSVAESFSLALRLAAPFVGLGMAYSLAIGFVSRAMPQLMVALVGAPAIVLAGLALLALSAPVMMTVWLDAFGIAVRNPL